MDHIQCASDHHQLRMTLGPDVLGLCRAAPIHTSVYGFKSQWNLSLWRYERIHTSAHSRIGAPRQRVCAKARSGSRHETSLAGRCLCYECSVCLLVLRRLSNDFLDDYSQYSGPVKVTPVKSAVPVLTVEAPGHASIVVQEPVKKDDDAKDSEQTTSIFDKVNPGRNIFAGEEPKNIESKPPVEPIRPMEEPKEISSFF
ncbi:hypothetical protein K439DRAFT_1612062 [Ramaria rubella]|nr:hypothetical protein K439DRAFT_1612062 [Ramaria rubella]